MTASLKQHTDKSFNLIDKELLVQSSKRTVKIGHSHRGYAKGEHFHMNL